ncbi:MAG: hypothetical protein WAM11_00295 [Cyanobium sp.]
MTEGKPGVKGRLGQRLRRLIRAGRFPALSRLAAVDRDQWMALAAYRGLVQQAFEGRPFAPRVSSMLWDQARFHPAGDHKAFFSPARRELEESSHHYGHDVQLKRYAGLPLIGPALPWLLEHGLKVSRGATFESPRDWSRGYLCMGPRRAGWLQERFGQAAEPIGPWIAYAQPLLAAAAMARLRQQLGPTLLVVLAHSWDLVERRMDQRACIEAVARQAASGGYRSVIWLRHWQDPELQDLPPQWIVACNGHRSNPWFLDAMRTLLELSDGLVSNAFGTHLGYGVALGKRLHWLPVAAEQDLSRLSQISDAKAAAEAAEWSERQRLSAELAARLALPDPAAADAAVRELLDPYWGFDCLRPAAELKDLLAADPATAPRASRRG